MAAARTGSVIANLELLNLNNYEDWKVRVKTYLLSEDLWDIVVGRRMKPPGRDSDTPEFKAWKKNDAKALYVIQSSCGVDTYSFIRRITNAKHAWDTLAREVEADQSLPWQEGSSVDSIDNPTDDAKQVDSEGEVKNNISDDSKKFVNFVESDDWVAAIQFVKDHLEVASARFRSGGTALHIAALQKKGDIGIELVKLMTPEDLEIKDKAGYIALHYVVGRSPPDNFELVKVMVEKNNELLSIPEPRNYRTSLLLAQMMDGGEEVAKYLYSLTDPSTLEGDEAADLVCSGLKLKRFDVALDLIRRDAALALEEGIEGSCPYIQLASLRSEVFESGTKLAFWEKWIYKWIHIDPAPTIDRHRKIEPTPTTDDARIDVKHEEKVKDNQKRTLSSGWEIIQKLRTRAAGLFSNGLKIGSVGKHCKLFGIHRIYLLKETHVRVLEFLEIICGVVKPDVLYEEHLKTVYEGIFLGIERGHVEFVSRLCQTNPLLLTLTRRNRKGQTILQVAAESRQEKIFNLIYHLDKESQRKTVSEVDNRGNNMLHIIGTYSPLAQNIRSPVLQMQRELQWYKEVESIARVGVLEMLNNDRKAPRELFTQTHKELVKKGEESVKNTATNCTLVGTLIATIMFTVAFTVPGGNDQDSGFPLFSHNKVFKIFIISDVVSLSFSITSVIIFLGIHTSPFAEDDFLVSLPTRMILGILSLLISINAMMIVFSAAIFIMLRGNTSVVIPTLACVCVPIISFVWTQVPFLIEIFISTYGSGVFKKNVEQWT